MGRGVVTRGERAKFSVSMRFRSANKKEKAEKRALRTLRNPSATSEFSRGVAFFALRVKYSSSEILVENGGRGKS